MKLVLVGRDLEVHAEFEVKEVPPAEVIRDGEKLYWFELKRPDRCIFREVRAIDLDKVLL